MRCSQASPSYKTELTPPPLHKFTTPSHARIHTAFGEHFVGYHALDLLCFCRRLSILKCLKAASETVPALNIPVSAVSSPQQTSLKTHVLIPSPGQHGFRRRYRLAFQLAEHSQSGRPIFADRICAGSGRPLRSRSTQSPKSAEIQ